MILRVQRRKDLGDRFLSVSRWTGIPVSKLSQTERERLLKLSEHLHRKVIGQNDAVDSVAEAVLRSRAGLSRDNQPIGSFLFLGQSHRTVQQTIRRRIFDLFRAHGCWKNRVSQNVGLGIIRLGQIDGSHRYE